MNDKRLYHYAWIILAACFADIFINYGIQLGYGVVLPEMIRDLQVSRTAAGTIFNTFFLTYLVLTPVAGYLTDRLGAARVITTGSLFLGLGTILMGRAASFRSACLFFGIVGVGAAGMWTPVVTLIQRWFAFSRRGLALGILSVSYGLGFAAVGAVFPWIVRYYNWRLAWYLLGSIAAAMTVFNGFFLKSDPYAAGCLPWGSANPQDDEGGRLRVSYTIGIAKPVLKGVRFWRIGLSFLAVCYGLYAITTFMVDYAQQMGLSIQKASGLAMVHGLGQVAGVLIILPLSDRLGRKKTIVFSNLCIALALAGIATTDGHWPIIYCLVAFLSFFYGATFPLYAACAGDYFPRAAIGTVVGAWTPFVGFGVMAAHWVTGWIRDATGRYQAAFLIAVFAALAAAFMMGAVPQAAGKMRDKSTPSNEKM